MFPALLEREYLPDVVTDQTSAHDPLAGYELAREAATRLGIQRLQT